MGGSFEIQRYLNEGWELFRDNMANLVVAAIILMVINIAASFIWFASLLVSGPMMGGMYYVIMDIEAGKPFNAMRVFDGFRLKFVPLVLIGILATVFIMGGFMLLIFPGLLVMGWYFFPYLFAIDKDMDFWPALEASRKIGFNNHLNVFFLASLLVVINFAGALALGVGILVTIPYTFCVIKKAYDHQVSGHSISSTGVTPPPPPPPPITP